jgi:hypothetical protein
VKADESIPDHPRHARRRRCHRRWRRGDRERRVELVLDDPVHDDVDDDHSVDDDHHSVDGFLVERNPHGQLSRHVTGTGVRRGAAAAAVAPLATATSRSG